MVSEVVMPQMGADMTEGTLLRWLKHEGDQVARGDVIAEIETDKANVEIEAFDGGVFRKALANEGDTVNVGEVIAIIGGADEDISKYAAGNSGASATTAKAEGMAPAKAVPAPATPTAKPAPDAVQGVPTAGSDGGPEVDATSAGETPPTPVPPAEIQPPQPPAAAAPAPDAGRVRASPLAKRTAAERGIDLRSLRGSGPDGRILQKDVEAAPPTAARPQQAAPAASAPAPARAPDGPPSKMRQAIARRMSQSKREAPHYYLLVDIDMTEAMSLRTRVNETLGEDARVSINDLIVRAAALALQRHPQFNATIEGETVTRHDQQHICIGIALDDGLIAPALVGAGSMTLAQVASATKDLVGRAKGGSLKADEITAGTFTISNLGAFGIETLVAIIQPPQTAILGVGSVAAQPAARDGAVVVRQMMKVALSADHRVTDGAQGAAFLGEIKALLEKPLSLLL